MDWVNVLFTTRNAIAFALTFIGSLGLVVAALAKGLSWEFRLCITLVAAAVICAVLLWRLPGAQTAYLGDLDDKGRFDAENEARKTLAQILAGVAVLGRVHTTRRASTMSANERKPRKRTSSFSNREKIRRKPLSLRNSRSISLRFL